MPRELFVGDPSLQLGVRKWYTVPLSIAIHVIVISAVVVIPLMATDVLPTPPGMMSFVAAAPPPPPPPPPKAPVDSTPPAKPAANPDAAPIAAPDTIEPELEFVARGAADPGVIRGVEGGMDIGVVDTPPAPPPPVAQAPVRVSQTRAPKKIRNVEPVYPKLALAARVQGTVVVEATIAPDGQVIDATVIRSIPLLDAAALDAVRQWQYTPTMLSGAPVAVIMTVTVTFQLR